MDYYETKAPSLNRFLGGGFGRESGTLVRYQQADTAVRLVLQLGLDLLDSRLSLVITPSDWADAESLRAYLDMLGASLEPMLRNDQLFVLGPSGEWPDHRNVFALETPGDLQTAVETAWERSRSRGIAHLVEVRQLYGHLGEAGCRTVREWYGTDGLRGRRDFLVDFLNLDSVPASLDTFYTEQDQQGVTLTDGADGPTITLDRAPEGPVGETRRMRFTDSKPFLELE